jgi:Tfp pilus assembly protein FimT
MKSCGTAPHSLVESAPWWAHLVGAPSFHPDQHWPDYPAESDRGSDERSRNWREEFPEAEAARDRDVCEGWKHETVDDSGLAGRGHLRCPRPVAVSALGFTVLDIVFAAATLCVLMAVAMPQVMSTVNRSRGLAAARYLAARMALARAQAVSRSTTVALYLREEPTGISISTIQDGNRNGVRTRDIDLQIDRTTEEAVALSDLFPGVEIGLTPQVPVDDAVQLGGTSILSFTPHGTATSGSVYVRGRDGTQWVVRVLGVTARSRVLRYVPATGEWVSAS